MNLLLVLHIDYHLQNLVLTVGVAEWIFCQFNIGLFRFLCRVTTNNTNLVDGGNVVLQSIQLWELEGRAQAQPDKYILVLVK